MKTIIRKSIISSADVFKPWIPVHVLFTQNYTFTKWSQTTGIVQTVSRRSVCSSKHNKTFFNSAYLNPACVRLKTSGRVLGGHPALDGAAVHSDLVLFEAQLWQAAALAHMQLGVHQIHTVWERGDEVNKLIETLNMAWTALKFPWCPCGDSLHRGLKTITTLYWTWVSMATFGLK